MAGLSCGEPSSVAWPVVEAAASHFLTVSDRVVAPAMMLLAEGTFGDEPMVAGEAGVAGLLGLLCAHDDPETWRALGLDESSRVLVINTEGATDPTIYRALTGHDPERVRSPAPDSSR